ncbi:MAG: hypothetical protein UHH87_05780 [Akkermansia sp.]|nr:hypothetical protein [Akkermansia sp.]MEE1265779.1 hypothetical protein [Akkermansia sp.]
MRIFLILSYILCLFTSCRYMSLGPYKHYRISNDEAVPASKVGGAPWRNKRG